MTKQEAQIIASDEFAGLYTSMEKAFIGYRIVGKVRRWIWKFRTMNKKPAF